MDDTRGWSELLSAIVSHFRTSILWHIGMTRQYNVQWDTTVTTRQNQHPTGKLICKRNIFYTETSQIARGLPVVKTQKKICSTTHVRWPPRIPERTPNSTSSLWILAPVVRSWVKFNTGLGEILNIIPSSRNTPGLSKLLLKITPRKPNYVNPKWQP